MSPRVRRGRARRVLRGLGLVVGTMLTFVTATAASAIVHLDAPATRRLVIREVNDVLREQLAGDVVVERLGGLGLRGLEGVSVRMRDPEGLQVLHVDGVRVRVRALEAARSFLFGEGDIVVPVDSVVIDHVDAAIDGDHAGNLRIANVFEARTKKPPEPTDPSARGVRVEAPDIRLDHAWVHGQAPGAPPVDADVNGLVGRAHYDPKLTTAELDRVDLATRGLPRGVDPRGRLGGHFRMPSTTGTDMGLDAAFDGVVAGTSTIARVHLDGKKLDAVVDGHDKAGAGMRATFGEVGIREEVTLHAEAHGELPRIAARAHVALGRGTVDLDGHVDTSTGTKADARVAIRHVDLHAIVPSAPVSDLGLDTTANVVVDPSGAVDGSVALDTLPGTVAGEAVPLLRARGAFTKETAHGNGHIVDPRGTADFEASMTKVGKSSVLEGALRTSVVDLSRLPEMGAGMKGHASITANAKVDLGAGRLEARAHAVAGDLAYGAQTVDNATVVATARGSLDHPVIDVGLHAGGVASGEQRLGVAELRARVEPGAVTTVRDAHVDVVREGWTLSAHAERVQIGGPRTIIEGAVVTGLGEPLRADLSRDANEIRANVDAPSVDLQRVALIVGKNDILRGGRLSMNGSIALRRDRATGELHAKVDSLAAGQIEGGTMSVDASFDGTSIGLAAAAELGEAGTFEIATSDVVIGGSPIDPASWKRARGKMRFSANVELAKLATLVPEARVPVSDLHGIFVVAGVVRRDSSDVPPELQIHAHTRGLVVAGKGTPEALHDPTHHEVVSGVQPWRSEGVDASIDARIDATSGQGEVAFRATDTKGTLVAFDGKSTVPYAQILSDPGNAIALMKDAPLSAKLIVPKRAFADMPELSGAATVPGTFEAELDVSGTALDPRVALVAHARGVRSPALAPKASADVDIGLDYDGQKGDLVAKVAAEQHEVMDLTAHVDLRSRDLVEPTGQPLDWGGSARIALSKFPIETVGALADRRVRGHVSGEVVLEDLHHDAKLHGEIALDQLKVGRAAYERGKIVVDARGGKATAELRIDQSDGYVDLRAGTGLLWGAAVTPSLDPNANFDAHLVAKAFRAAAILPFVKAQMNALDGRIDADATARIGPGFGDPTMVGKIIYSEGTFQIAALGEQFKDARATVTLQPGVIKIDDVFARGTGGELTAGALVRTRGFALASAEAQLHIPDRRELDLSFNGQPIGAVSGDATLVATNSEDGKRLDVKVDVPKLDLELPQQMKSGVQELSENESIRVGTFRGPRTFVKLPLDKQDLEPPSEDAPAATVTEVDVHLGEVTVVQGNMVRVVLTGDPHLRIANETTLSGQIAVKSGKVDVQGKKFEIEKGTITFQSEDTSNPIIVATAGWTADDGSRVYADFVGPLKTGKVTLRSDPPRPRNEILAMILFGTADGANAPPPPPGRAPDGTTKAAASLGGGFAAQGLTEAMDDLTGIEATARINTTRSANPAPEIEVQIARTVSLAFSHILGTPPLSQPDTNLAIVEWRFRRNWSLEATFGDRGKVQTDAIWTKRY